MDYVTVKSLAEELNMDRSHCRRYILGLDIEPVKMRTVDSANQKTLVVTEGEAEFIREQRGAEGFTGNAIINRHYGEFYIIRLVPELDESRYKLGYSGNAENRLRQHRTSAPTAEIVNVWACKDTWEGVVIDVMAQHGRLILNEVYEFDDIDEIVEVGDKLFSMLPDPGSSVGLSKLSPLRGS